MRHGRPNSRLNSIIMFALRFHLYKWLVSMANNQAAHAAARYQREGMNFYDHAAALIYSEDFEPFL